MESISTPVIKKDHYAKVSGTEKYIDDLKLDNMLYAATVRSQRTHALIKSIHYPGLEKGEYVIDYKDVPGINLMKVVSSEHPIFAEHEVTYIGQPIALILTSDEERAKELAGQTFIEYEELDSVLELVDAKESLAGYSYCKGDIESAFAKCHEVIEETFETGYQEQAYLEPQGVIGDYDGNVVTVYASMQCPYYVHSAVMQTMGFSEDKVRAVQMATGGGFGGKEDFPSLIGSQAAVASFVTKCPVKLVYGRREDLSFTPKRHPAKLKYKVALDADGNIMGMDVDIKINAGAFLGLTGVVLQRSLITAAGVYKIENINVLGKAMMTNTIPNGAYRGFGAPQSFFSIEELMSHIAYKLGKTPLEYKSKYFVEQGDDTTTGGKFHHYVPIKDMVKKAEEISGYSEKYAKYKNQSGRYRKGIGMSVFYHGCGFTGSQERDVIKSVVKVVKYENDKVEILACNGEIGQGIRTTFSKIAAKVLDIPYEDVIYEYPDTSRVPNSGPTVASRSLMIPGKLVERAALHLKKIWKSGERQEVEEHYVHPDLIPWDGETFSGDAYPTFSWGLNVVEVEVDTVTARTRITAVWNLFDVGKAIDETIILGQIEGGMLQGLGYASCEKMECINGRIRQNSITDYIIPTSMDTVNNKTVLVDNEYDLGPFGGKGAGELTLIGAPPAYTTAIENAVGIRVNSIPYTPEKLMEEL